MDKSGPNNSNQGRRLQQVGIALFLAAILLGLFVSQFAVPRLALSAHLVGLLQGIFVLVLGLLWSRLRLTVTQANIAFWLLVYQGVAAIVSNILAGVWGAGNSIVPLAAGSAHGSSLQEAIIAAGLRSSGVTLIVALLLVAWGLRGGGPQDSK
jgi:(hydroxyamino)benzene mutase